MPRPRWEFLNQIGRSGGNSGRRHPGRGFPRLSQGKKSMSQVIAVPRETATGEKRVATVPEIVERLVKLGFQVSVQSGAGEPANFSDDDYRAAGARIVDGASALWAAGDIVFKVRAPTAEEIGL